MHATSFKDCYRNNKGTLYRHYEITVNNSIKPFDVYLGDPDIIFRKSIDNPYPLAFIKFPKWANEPDTRIYLHEKIELKYSRAFEYILAHEIGHFCLFDIFGINHPKGNIFLNVFETEVWADYFAYLYFNKYKNIHTIEELESIFLEIDNLQYYLYDILTNDICQYSYTNKLKHLKEFSAKIEIAISNNDKNTGLMLKIFDEILVQVNELA